MSQHESSNRNVAKQDGIPDMSFTKAVQFLPTRDVIYQYMNYHFNALCPEPIRQHRQFFCTDNRGFGENVFHAMWYLLFREFNPRQCLEIGVYRGQVLSLWGLIAKLLGQSCDIHGISPFLPIGDSVSTYRTDVDYYKDTLDFSAAFDLPPPTLVRALSTDAVALEHIAQGGWDVILIDGGHDYDVVVSDYAASHKALKTGGLLVMDDSSIGTDFTPSPRAFLGHPGPSRVAQERAMKEMKFLGGVGHNNVFQKI